MENDNKDQNLTEQVSHKSVHKSRFIYIILLVLVLFGAVYYIYNKNKTTEKDLNLSPSEVEQLGDNEQTRVLQAQLRDLQSRAEVLTDQSSKSDRFVVYIQLAEVQTSLGLYDDALKSLDTIQKENEGNTRLWMTYAQVYKAKGDNSGARTNVDMAMKIDDGIADNWLFLFSVSGDLPKEEQEAQFKEASTKTENDPEITQAYEAWKTAQAS